MLYIGLEVCNRLQRSDHISPSTSEEATSTRAGIIIEVMDEVLESLHPLLISPLSTFHMCLQVTIQEQELVATEGEINTK